MSSIRYRMKSAWLSLTKSLRKTYTANSCGHKTKRAGKLTSLGDERIVTMPLSENGNPDYCLDCIAAMSIRCAWCNNPIHISDPVTLYEPKQSFVVPEHAIRYDETRLVGCLGWECADTGGDRQGFWMPPGKVHRVPSAIERLMHLNAVGAEAIMVRDLSDPNDHGQVV